VSDLVFVEQRPMAGRVLQIEPDLTIGREGCDIVLPDPEVSRRHAIVRILADNTPAIDDLGSTNGTYVNDRPIHEPTRLAPGDVVRFGNTLWHVASPGAETLVRGLRADP
jgi:pSer/pThr/pTyr-binding forkhead associated (FHA) protein